MKKLKLLMMVALTSTACATLDTPTQPTDSTQQPPPPSFWVISQKNIEFCIVMNEKPDCAKMPIDEIRKTLMQGEDNNRSAY